MKYKRSGSKMEDVTYNIPDFPVYLCWGEFAPPHLLPHPQPLARRPGIFIHGVGAAVL